MYDKYEKHTKALKEVIKGYRCKTIDEVKEAVLWLVIGGKKYPTNVTYKLKNDVNQFWLLRGQFIYQQKGGQY